MRKLICILLSFIMVFSFSIQSIATNNSTVLYDEDGILITLIEETDNYQKIKIDNKNSNKIEYLESYLQKDDSYLYKAITENSTYTINNSGNEVLVLDEDDNIIEKISIINNLGIEKHNIESELNNYPIPDGKWRATHMKGYSSSSIFATDLSLVIGIIAAICLKSATAGVVVAIGTWYFSRKLPEAYYYYEEQTRVYNGWIQRRQYTVFYKNSDYDYIVDSVYSEPYNYYPIR